MLARTRSSVDPRALRVGAHDGGKGAGAPQKITLRTTCRPASPLPRSESRDGDRRVRTQAHSHAVEGDKQSVQQNVGTKSVDNIDYGRYGVFKSKDTCHYMTNLDDILRMPPASPRRTNGVWPTHLGT